MKYLQPIKYFLINEWASNSSKEDVYKAIQEIMSKGFVMDRHIFLTPQGAESAVVLEIRYFDGHLWLSSILCAKEDRNKGYATQIMNMLIEIADKYNVAIACGAEPFGLGKKMNRNQLINWYKKFGFVPVRGDRSTLERVPNGGIPIGNTDKKVLNKEELSKHLGEVIKDEQPQKDNSINPKYTHFAVRKSDNKIVTGWEYDKDTDSDEVKHYSKIDLKDWLPENKPSDFSVLTKQALLKRNVDPFDRKNWYTPEA